MELPRLGDGAARELRTTDPRREPEVVLDAPRRSRLPAERRAVDDERLEPFRGAVDGGTEAGGARADHEQVDFLPASELAADPQRAIDLAGRRGAQLHTARQAHERQARRVESGVGFLPCEREAIAPGVLEHPHRRLRRSRAHDLQTDAFDLLQCLAARDEGREQEVAQRSVLEQHRTQRLALDGDVPQRLRDDRGDEHRLPREEVQFAEEVRRAVPGDVVARGIEDRHLAIDDRDERVAAIADAIQHIPDVRAAFLAELGQRRQLRRGQRRARGRDWDVCHGIHYPIATVRPHRWRRSPIAAHC